MKKCDFCTQSSPKGECRWKNAIIREEYCAKAIKNMVAALKCNCDYEKCRKLEEINRSR